MLPGLFERLRLKLMLRRGEQLAKLGQLGYFREAGKHSPANPTVLVKRPVWTVGDKQKGLEHPGRPNGRVPGAYVSGDLSELQKTILLCSACRKGFDWKKHHYYSVAQYDRIYARGKCDVCRASSDKLYLYLHEAHQLAGFCGGDRFRRSRLGATIV